MAASKHPIGNRFHSITSAGDLVGVAPDICRLPLSRTLAWNMHVNNATRQPIHPSQLPLNFWPWFVGSWECIESHCQCDTGSCHNGIIFVPPCITCRHVLSRRITWNRDSFISQVLILSLLGEPFVPPPHVFKPQTFRLFLSRLRGPPFQFASL